MRFALSIGRRQPMHRMHVDCIREILAEGLTPLIVVGSVNGADSPYFDPLKNPLNWAQQQAQIRAALPFLPDPVIIPQLDVADLARWCEEVAAKLPHYGASVADTCMHYRVKQSEVEQGEAALERSLLRGAPVFERLGVKSWRSTNKNPADDLINATELRSMPIDDPRFRELVAAPDYLIAEIKAARTADPEREKLENTPLTMADLTRQRLRLEKNSC